MQSHNYSYEIIFLDDGSTIIHGLIERICSAKPNVKRSFYEKLLENRRLACWFAKAQGDVIITMDADLQDSPEIPGLYDMIVNGKYDLVSGWKRNVTILLLLKPAF
jgi:glycosyltransferase involved in cell wall biosynthesis